VIGQRRDGLSDIRVSVTVTRTGRPHPPGGRGLTEGGGTPPSLCPGGGVSPSADHYWRLGSPTNRGRYIGIRIPHNNKQTNTKRNWLKKKRCRSGTRELGVGKAIGLRAFLLLIVVAGSCPCFFFPVLRILGRTGTSARSVAAVPVPPSSFSSRTDRDLGAERRSCPVPPVSPWPITWHGVSGRWLPGRGGVIRDRLLMRTRR
jgi:hypothetical protein